MNTDELTELLSAVRTQDLTRLREHLKDPEKVSARTSAGYTLLHAAAEEGSVDMVTLLLEAGIPINASSSYGETPLHLAARCGLPSVALMHDVEFGNHHPWVRTFRQADSPEFAKIVFRILHRLNPNLPADPPDLDPVQMALEPSPWDDFHQLQKDHQRLLRELENEKINLAEIFPELADKLKGHLRYRETVNVLLNHGADINAITSIGTTALYSTVGDKAMTELLLARGADPNLCGSGTRHTPLSAAIAGSHIETAKILFQHGEKPDFGIPHSWMHHTAEHGKVELLEWLIGLGGDVNQLDEEGNTALMRAARSGNHNSVETLCRYGGDLLIRNKEGQTCLHMAAYWNQCLKPILALHPPVNLQGNDGLTPLHIAAREHRVIAIQLLLAAGADIRLQDKDGNTPLHMIFLGDGFLKNEQMAIITTLLDGGVDRSIKNNHGKTAFELGNEQNFPKQYLDLLRAEK